MGDDLVRWWWRRHRSRRPGASHGTRDGTTIQASDYGSSESALQAALDDLSEGDTLDIDPDYTGSHWDFPGTDHVTITSSTGAALHLESGGQEIFDWECWSDTSVSADPIAAGETTVSVADASAFSPGDDVQILDPNEVYRGIEEWASGSTGAGQDLDQGQLAVVESVDTSAETIALDETDRTGRQGTAVRRDRRRTDRPTRGSTTGASPSPEARSGWPTC